MSEKAQPRALKRPAFLLGLVISILSVCGIILATGNLISLQHPGDLAGD
jgi:hypothetical protein